MAKTAATTTARKPSGRRSTGSGDKAKGRTAATGAAKKTVDIGFLGGGNMADALLRGLLASGRDPSSLLVSEPDAAKRRALTRRYAVATTADNGELVRASRTIVLAVKPQVLGEVLAGVAAEVTSRELYVSIAAGVPLARLEKWLGGRARVVRVMPNTPSLVGKGAAVLCAGAHATAADLRTAKRIFAAVGDAHVVTEEKLLHMVTALSGSGPAYVYRFAEALVAAAVKGGLAEPMARSLAYQTLAGAAAMMIETGQGPEDLRRAVSSPGGTTLAGLAALDERGFLETVAAGVAAAARRSIELGKG